MAPDTARQGDQFVQSFARGLAVIRSFNSLRPRQTLSEVAVATGLTRASARRILLTLVQLGYVQLDARQFSLTPKILDLGFAYLTSMPFWDVAEPIMQALVDTVHESCSASVLDATDIVYVVRIPTHKIMTINLAIGSRLPAFCTSMGRVLLAGLDDAQIDSILDQSDLQSRTARTVTSRMQLKRLILDVRRHGWALVNQELEEGLISIAAPVFDRQGKTIAALNISGQANRTSAREVVERFLPPLREAAARLTETLRLR